MGKNILRQLFDGEIYPSENINPDSEEYNEAKRVLAEEKECFMKTLSESDRERFTKIIDLHFDAAGIYSYECFAHGFRLGAALMVEALNGTDDFARNGDE